MDDINLHYKIEGNGETLVFIHGLSDNMLYWEFLASNLKKDYQILRVDLRGHGESDFGSGEITSDTYVADLHGILKKLNLKKVNLIGFSIGGAIALDFSIEYPQMVSSLVLMSSFSKTDQHSRNIMNQFKDALINGFENFYDLILPRVLCPKVIEENRKELEQLKEIASQNANVNAFIKAVDAFLNFDVENELPKIDIPTLILAGRHDDIFPLSTQEELQGQIENSRLIVFDDVRHNLLVGKNNEKMLSILNEFYKK